MNIIRKIRINWSKKYNELGYRDMFIVGDSVWNNDSKHVNIYMKINEGKKYYIRKYHMGRQYCFYPTDQLNSILRMKKGRCL